MTKAEKIEELHDAFSAESRDWIDDMVEHVAGRPPPGDRWEEGLSAREINMLYDLVLSGEFECSYCGHGVSADSSECDFCGQELYYPEI